MVSESADWWGWAATVAFAATGRRPFGKGPFEACCTGCTPVRPTWRAGPAPEATARRGTLTRSQATVRPRTRSWPASTGTPRAGTHCRSARPRPEVAVPETVQLHPADRADDPGDAVGRAVDPTEVAELVPPVIPPWSAFTPIRDKIRDAAARSLWPPCRCTRRRTVRRRMPPRPPRCPCRTRARPHAGCAVPGSCAVPAGSPSPYQQGPSPTPYQQPGQPQQNGGGYPEKPPKAPPSRPADSGGWSGSWWR